MNHDASWGMAAMRGATRGRYLRGRSIVIGVVMWAVTVPAAVAEGPPLPGPNGSAAPGRCTQYEGALAQLAPPGGWDVNMMSAFMWRESKCDPTARSATFDTGLLQINDVNHPHLRVVLGEWVGRWSLTDPLQNIRAAAALCTYWQARGKSCYYPWKLVTPAPVTRAPATPTVLVSGRCVDFEATLAANAPAAGWDVERMSRIMYAVSRCRPTARSSSTTGLLRISNVNLPFLRTALGQSVTRQTLQDPTQNVRAAAAMCTRWRGLGKSCYAPWGGSG